ncbi:MAG: radical SAM family heme chaperone HemW [Pontiellaceae bacterium]|nr:radical SAM family heme chaperone HemW [Pontiellaceae bacterium]
MRTEANITGLYIHIPFCVSKCRYCDFYRTTPNDDNEIDSYVETLALELMRLPDGFAPQSVFVGGGTPTILSAQQYEILLNNLHRYVDLSAVDEFTSEANPGTLSPEKIAAMKQGGVNRVSIGVQTFHSPALRLLGRIHSAQQAADGVKMLRAAGFDNINIDMIQSIPGMSMDQVLDDARRLTELDPEHISYYNLVFEDGTPITADRDAGRLQLSDEDGEADNYYAVRTFLKDSGYAQYEISNFSKFGYECRHNMLYWQGGSYLGCGPAAHSHWGGRRFGNIADVAQWSERLRSGRRPFDDVEELSPNAKARETLIMWLRMTKGVDLNAFHETTGYTVDELSGDAIRFLEREGLLRCTDDRLSLTSDALFVCNAVFSELI